MRWADEISAGSIRFLEMSNHTCQIVQNRANDIAAMQKTITIAYAGHFLFCEAYGLIGRVLQVAPYLADIWRREFEARFPLSNFNFQIR
jgi:hypothetical protein